MVAVTMEVLWCTYLLWVLVVAPPAHAERNPPGLSCVNDYVRNISCTWNSSHVGIDCWVFGTKKMWKNMDNSIKAIFMIRSCRLKPLEGSARSCNFVFENESITYYEVLPSIQVVCNGVAVENLTNYSPIEHIKLHPPSVPRVFTNGSETLIFWSPGTPLPSSVQPDDLEFEVQIKQPHQKWQESDTLPTSAQKLRVPGDWTAERYQVRVRVKISYPSSHWSDWSPTASWETEADHEAQVSFLDLKSWLLLGGLCLFLIIIKVLILFKMNKNPGLLRRKPFPDPSKYFHTLHSVNRGNLKQWLNPQPESFFAAPPPDGISPVEVDDNWDGVSSSSPAASPTTSAVLFHPHPVDPSSSSSSSSSCFSNLGYSGSSCPDRPVPRRDPSPVYFTYQEEFVHVQVNRALRLTIQQPPRLPDRTPSYELLELPGAPRTLEPQSPDSGFGMEDHELEQEEEEEEEEGDSYEDDWEDRGETVSADRPGAPLILLPVHLSSRLCSPEARAGSYAAWPIGATMGSASSMPASPCNTGYLTVKELQTTYSNKSI